MDFLTDAETKEAAFEKGENEVNIPIARGEHEFRFTRRWFKQRNQVTWSTHLLPLFSGRRARRRPVRMIQIGVFEGADLIWCLQNFAARHAGSRVLAIDPWELEPSRKMDEAFMRGVRERAEWNLRPWRKMIRLEQGRSQTVLPSVIENPIEIHGHRTSAGNWDLIVVDGDHRAAAALGDARLAFQLVKPGGYIVFDDVRNRVRKKDHVADALRTFLWEHGDEVELVWFHRHANCYRKLK